jgi:fatty acid desaturase
MTQNTSNPAMLTTAQKTARIKAVVMQAGDELRARHPLLRHTDAIGVTILLLSLAGMIASGVLYLKGFIPWWVCVPVTAIFASFTHELEHDLIHQMYFRRNPVAHNLMLAVVWLARPSTINPWIRRHLHLNHHKVSGSETDIEERAITNGEPWGLRRLVMTGDNIMAVVLRMGEAKGARRKARLLARGLAAHFPLAWLSWGTWYAFVGFHLADGAARLAGHPLDWSATTLSHMQLIDAVTVVIVAPNVLRTFCLHFISSNMHYYGDVEPGNVLQQTQVLNAWWLAPLHLFCFNFGSTHGIHHFVVKEPFYIRQMTAKKAHAVMHEMGVRFNDFGTFRRANRYAGLQGSVSKLAGAQSAA